MQKNLLKKIFALAGGTIALLVIIALVFSSGGTAIVESASYNSFQTKWDGGLDPNAIVVHATSSTAQYRDFGNKYAATSTDIEIELSGDPNQNDKIKLGSVIRSSTSTTELDFNNGSHNETKAVSAGGGGVTLRKPPLAVQKEHDTDIDFAQGEFINTLQNGNTGATASVILKEQPTTTIIYMSNTTHDGDFSASGNIRNTMNQICSTDANKPDATQGDIAKIQAFIAVDTNDTIANMHTAGGGINKYDSNSPIYWYKDIAGTASTTKFANNWASLLTAGIIPNQVEGTSNNSIAWTSGLNGDYDSANSCVGWTSLFDGAPTTAHTSNATAYDTTWLSSASTDQCVNTHTFRCVAEFNQHKYKNTGVYTGVLDAGPSTDGYTWQSMNWNGTYPADTKIILKVKTSSSTNPVVFDGSGECVATTTAPGTMPDISTCTSGADRYMHYKATLFASSDEKYTPSLDKTAILVETYSGSYAQSGSYTSEVFSTEVNHQGFSSISYTADTSPQGTGVQMNIRSCNDAACQGGDDHNNAFTTGACSVGNNQNIASHPCLNPADKYFQFEAGLSSSNGANTPLLEDVYIRYKTYTTEEQFIVSSKYDASNDTSSIGGVEWLEDQFLPNDVKVSLYLRTASSANGLDGEPWVEIASSTRPAAASIVSPVSSCTKSGTHVTCNKQAIPLTLRDGVADTFFQYRLGILSSNGENTAEVSRIDVVYVLNDPPEFDAGFGTNGVNLVLNNDETMNITYRVRDPDTDDGVTPFSVQPSFEYSNNNGTTWNLVTNGLPASATSAKQVEKLNYREYSFVWDPHFQSGLVNTYTNQFKFRVVADDSEGSNNIGYAEIQNAFELDLKSPTFANPILNATEYANNNPVILTLNATDNTTLSTEINFDGNFTGNTHAYINTENITLPSYPATVYVRITDAFGNKTDKTITTITRPNIVNLQDLSVPNNGVFALLAVWNVANIPVNQFLKYEIWRSENNNLNYVLHKTITDKDLNYYYDGGLAQGTDYFYKIITKDILGNISAYAIEKQGKPTVGSGGQQNQPPNISNHQVATTTDTTATITWDTDVFSNSLIKYDIDPNTDFSTAQSQGVLSFVTAHSVQLVGLVPDTDYYIRLESALSTGETGIYPVNGTSIHFKTQAALGNNTPPNIIFNKNSDISNVTDSSATIRWTTDKLATSTFQYGVNTVYTATPIIDTTPRFPHQVDLTGLIASTTYFFKLTNADINGNATSTHSDINGEFSFTTLVQADNTPPIIDNVSNGSPGSDTVTITWQTDKDASSQVDYNTVQDGTFPFHQSASGNTQNHNVALVGLNPNVTYYYQVRSATNGNEAIDSNNNQYTFTTSSAGALTIVPNTISTTVGANTATVLWQTNLASNSRVEYATGAFYTGSGNTYNKDSGTDTILTKQHAVTLSSLLQDTVYHFKITSDDTHGGIATSSDAIFKTIIAGTATSSSSGGSGGSRGTPPSITDITITNITDTGALVSWVTNKDSDSAVDFAINDIQDFGGALTQGSSALVRNHAVQLNRLLPGTTYSIRVRSTDGRYAGQSIYDGTITTLGDALVIPPDTTASTSATSSQTLQELLTNFGQGLSPSALEQSFRDVVNRVRGALPAPVISGVPQFIEQENALLVTWRTDKPTNSLVQFSLADEYIPENPLSYKNQIGETDEYTTVHEVSIPNLEPDTTYHFRARGKTEVGAEVSSKDIEYKTQTEKPVVSNARIEYITDTSATVSWQTSVPADSIVKFTPFNPETKKIDETQIRVEGSKDIVKNHSIELKGLVPGTKYAITLEGANEDGITYSFDLSNINTSKDIIAPEIEGIKTESAILPGKEARVRSIIFWNTNEVSSGQVAYVEIINNKKLTKENIKQALEERAQAGAGRNGLYAHNSGVVLTGVNTGLTGEHLAVLTQLKQGGTYAFKVMSTDASGNTAYGDTFVLMVPQKKQGVFDLIVKTFESRFKWLKR